MIKIKHIDKKGNQKLINANKGLSLLEVSKNNNINLEGSCGGEMLCSTCHVYILSNHISKLKKKTQEEKEILALTENLKKNSRLACQIERTSNLDGLIFCIA
jgi:ferredoxin